MWLCVCDIEMTLGIWAASHRTGDPVHSPRKWGKWVVAACTRAKCKTVSRGGYINLRRAAWFLWASGVRVWFRRWAARLPVHLDATAAAPLLTKTCSGNRHLHRVRCCYTHEAEREEVKEFGVNIFSSRMGRVSVCVCVSGGGALFIFHFLCLDCWFA